MKQLNVTKIAIWIVFSIKMTDSMSFSDFRCSDKQFTCKNGECVEKDLLCDGDFACKDESDEDDCGCPSSMFRCQGEGCLPATAVCNRRIDCSNGDDENNCRKYAAFNKGVGFGLHSHAAQEIVPSQPFTFILGTGYILGKRCVDP